MTAALWVVYIAKNVLFQPTVESVQESSLHINKGKSYKYQQLGWYKNCLFLKKEHLYTMYKRHFGVLKHHLW